MLSSYLALSGILMALYRRQLTGSGDFVDVSMFESVLAASPNILGPVFGGDQAPDRMKERTHGGHAMLNIYETADGQYLALGAGSTNSSRRFSRDWAGLTSLRTWWAQRATVMDPPSDFCAIPSDRRRGAIGKDGLRVGISVGARWFLSGRLGNLTISASAECGFRTVMAMTTLAQPSSSLQKRLKSPPGYPL